MTKTSPPRGLGEDAWHATEAWAKGWWAAEDGIDRLASGGIPAGWAIHIEIFDAVLPAVLDALGAPPRDVGRGVWRRIKRRGWDRGARAWGLRASSLPRPGRSILGAEVLFISEQSTPSALEASLAVAACIPRDRIAVGIADPRARHRWRMIGVDPAPLIVNPLEEWRLVRAASRAAGKRWRAAAAAAPILSVAGNDLTNVALRAAEPIVRRSLAWLDTEAIAIERFLEQRGAHTVVLASDQHRIGRLTCHVARAIGVRTLVLQHGLPQATLGYVPVAADVIAVWSTDAFRWFRERDTPNERLRIVGNPRLDPLASRDRIADREAIARQTGLGGTPTILLALSVAPSDVNLRIVETAVSALRHLEAAQLIVKLHPGGSDWTAITRRLQAADVPRERVRVLDRAALYPLLGWADVVLVHRSTVAGEALAAGRPVVVIEAGVSSIATEEFADLDLPRVGDAETLARAVEELTVDEVAASFMSSRRTRLESIMGSLDGRSAERAAALALGLP